MDDIVYDYKDEDGKLLYQVVRKQQQGGKDTWSQRRPDGNGGYLYNLDGTRRVLYRLQELIQANPADWVFIAEGEKDVDRLYAEGLAGTTNSGGAMKKWDDSYSEFLSDKKLVAILPDNDEPGRKHARQIYSSLKRIGVDAEILLLDGLDKGGDVSDWLNNGGTKAMLLELANGKLPRLNEVCCGDVAAAPIEWFWDNKIPAGAMSLIIGDVGSGKSYFSMYMAAIVSTGGRWPNGQRADKGQVIIINDEDPDDVITSRLKIHGAELSNITIAKTANENKEFIDLQKHIKSIESSLLDKQNPQLVIIDPITAYLGRTNANSNAEVRAALTPLALLAQEYNITVIAISHLNKKVDLKQIYRGLGSTAFMAQARCVWSISADPEDKAVKIFAPIKTNYSYSPSGHKFSIPKDGPITFALEDYYGDIDDETSGQYKRSDEAADWLTEKLANGKWLAEELLREAKEAGFSRSTMDAAKKKLKVIAAPDGFQGKSFWRLSNNRKE